VCVDVLEHMCVFVSQCKWLGHQPVKGSRFISYFDHFDVVIFLNVLLQSAQLDK